MGTSVKSASNNVKKDFLLIIDRLDLQRDCATFSLCDGHFATSSNVVPQISLTMESKLQALKVPDLKKLLQDANLPVSGTKAELIKRLLEHPTATSSLGGGGGVEEEDLLG